MKILLTFGLIFIVMLIALVIVFNLVNNLPYSYNVKSFLNENIGTHYRLDTYSEFFGGNKEEMELAKSFNNGEISYSQYAIQKGYKIKAVPVVPLEEIDSFYNTVNSAGGIYHNQSVGTAGAWGGEYKGIVAGGGGGGDMCEGYEMMWYSVDENGSMVSGPGGCF